MVSSAAYADSNIKINVDDASRVSIKVNGVALNNIVNGENNIPLTASGSFEVKATDGNCLVDVVKKTTKGDTKQNIYSMTSCYVYVNLPDDNGSTINITTNTFAKLRTASCTIKVGKSEGATLWNIYGRDAKRWRQHHSLDSRCGERNCHQYSIIYGRTAL